MAENKLNPHLSTPLYEQLASALRSGILDGSYAAGSPLPSEHTLCEQFGVSRVTVRKALALLMEEQLLERRPGKGTFVRMAPLRRDLKSVNSFNETCLSLGRAPLTLLLRKGMRPAPAETARRLQVPEGADVVEIERLRICDGFAVMIETNRFPAAYAWLLEEDLETSLYGILRTRGIEPGQAVHDISLCYGTEAETSLLGVKEGSALLQLDEVIYDGQGAPLHTSRQLIRGDRFTFRI